MAGPTEAGAPPRAPAARKTPGTPPAASDTPDTTDDSAGPAPAIAAETLEELAEIGCTREEAAAIFEVSPAALEAALRDPALEAAWTRGQMRGRVHIRRSQYALVERSASMASHLGRVVLGQGASAARPAARRRLADIVDTGIERNE